ncbi:MAG: sugar transferase [Negativicutes bacterium]|jgi:exopolysaccharide biosynthesis polyprenyl glycosylphosphotransferase
MKNVMQKFITLKMLHRIFQYTVDIFISALALFITDALFFSIDIKYTALNNFELLYVPFLTFLTLFFFTVNDVYNYQERRLDETISRTIASLAKSIVILLVLVYFANMDSSRKMLVVYGFIVSSFYLAANIVRWNAYSRVYAKTPTLLFAKKNEAAWIVARISSHTQSRYNLAGWYDEVGNLNCINVKAIKTIILGAGFAYASVSELTAFCLLNNIDLIYVPSALAIMSNGASMHTIDDIMTFSAPKFRLANENRVAKRTLDLVFSFFALLFSFPLMLAVAIAIKLDSPGPIFYKQLRVGLNNKEFFVYKFRSMRNDAEKHTGAILSTQNDARLTKVGSFIRKTRIDEIPQFINVLLGNMSVVGPRPERKIFTDVFDKKIPFYYFRHHVKPGITGLAQIFGKYNTAPEYKILYDLYYINKCQKWGVLIADISIMLQTLNIFFSRSSAEGTFDLESIKTTLTISKDNL